ncbi:flavin-containing monooxygenase 1 [Diplodia corticola]|uniref:Flavin-containing monooxygenase 1 n=1 Tax=Diplodia corticola TaxID=236234 RepID=A0A1J9REN4_9PEZI|nr:flavin-containing monooxygenase 1 [Diplodia corticola]OJD31027.1 flavin-containing monooxygenase 1 [Diplodia corticola]
MALSTRNIFLVALGVIGTYGTWGRCFQDGTLGYILTAVFSDKQPFLLPGTDREPLIKNMTGIWPLDRLLAVLVLFFWQAADGSHPTTSAVGLYFAAQHLGLVVNMHLGSLHGRSKLNPTLWTLLFQALAIGTAGPLYAFLHLSTAAAAATTTPRLNAASTTRAIRSLPLACLLGYVLPALLMALRGHGFKQHAIAAWNVFPVWILLVQRLVQLPALLLLSPSSSSSSSSSSSFPSSSRAVYAATMLVAAAAHVATVALTAAAALFPMAFAPGYAAALRPGRVFVPPVALAAAPSSAATTATIGEGVRGFMLWDQAVGYAVVLFLAVDGLLGSWGVGREEEEESERIRHPHESVGIAQPKMDVKAAAVDDVGEIKKGRAAVRRDGRAWLVTGGAALLGAVLVGPAAVVLGLQWAADELAWKTVKEQKKRTGRSVATGPRKGRADQGR